MHKYIMWQRYEKKTVLRIYSLIDSILSNQNKSWVILQRNKTWKLEVGVWIISILL